MDTESDDRTPGNAKRAKRVKELFDLVHDNDRKAITRFLVDVANREDPGSGDELQDMLEAEKEHGTAPTHPVTEHTVNYDVPENEAEELVPGTPCGSFRIEKKIGSGGMGHVYLATRYDDLDLKVALKTLTSWHPDMKAIFQRECKILSNLRHPHIAHLIDAGIRPNGQPWLAMEYVEGRNAQRPPTTAGPQSQGQAPPLSQSM